MHKSIDAGTWERFYHTPWRSVQALDEIYLHEIRFIVMQNFTAHYYIVKRATGETSDKIYFNPMTISFAGGSAAAKVDAFMTNLFRMGKKGKSNKTKNPLQSLLLHLNVDSHSQQHLKHARFSVRKSQAIHKPCSQMMSENILCI